jgi:hypothetical protein
MLCMRCAFLCCKSITHVHLARVPDHSVAFDSCLHSLLFLSHSHLFALFFFFFSTVLLCVDVRCLLFFLATEEMSKEVEMFLEEERKDKAERNLYADDSPAYSVLIKIMSSFLQLNSMATSFAFQWPSQVQSLMVCRIVSRLVFFFFF